MDILISQDLIRSYLQKLISILISAGKLENEREFLDLLTNYIIEHDIDVSRVSADKLLIIIQELYENSAMSVAYAIRNISTNSRILSISRIRNENRALPVESKTYELAEYILSHADLDFKKLTFTQLIILREWTRNLEERGQLQSIHCIVESTGIPKSGIYKHLNNILQKFTSEDVYMRNVDGVLKPLDKTNPLYKLIKLYQKNTNLLKNRYLKPRHTKYLKPLFDAIESDIIPSIESIASGINIKRRTLDDLIEDAYERITDESIYYDKDKERLSKREVRIILLPFHLNPSIRCSMTVEDVNLMDLLMLKEGRIFCFSYEDIARTLEIKTENPNRTVISRVNKLVNRVKKIISLFENSIEQ